MVIGQLINVKGMIIRKSLFLTIMAIKIRIINGCYNH